MNEPRSSPTRPKTTTALTAAADQPPASYPTAIVTEEQSGWIPTSNNNSPRRHTLKDRIRRNMLANSLPPSINISPTTMNNNNMMRLSSTSSYNNLSSEGSTTTSHNTADGIIHRGGDEPSRKTKERRSSVLDAASALASLGFALPKVAAPPNSSSSSPSSSCEFTPLSTDGGGMDGIVDRVVNQIDENIRGGEGRGRDQSTSRRLYELYHPAPSATVTGITTRHGRGKGQGEEGDVGLCGIRPPPSLLSTSTSHPPPHQFASKGTTVGMAQDVGRSYNNANNNQTSSLLGSSSTDIPLTFPQKLMEVLSNPEVSNVITWLPHGKGFIILQKRRFSMYVMPLYFKHSKFTSFTRKLNRWGFTRVSRGPEMGAYYHKLFQRGNYMLCMQMCCQSTNKSFSSPTSAVSSKNSGTSKKTKDKEVDGGSKKTKVAPRKKKKKSTAAGAVKLSSPKASITMVPTLELFDDDDEEMVNEEKDSTKAGGGDPPIMSPRIRMLLPPIGTSTGSQYQQHQGRHFMQKEHTGNSGFDHAFSRQQAFLRTNNHEQVVHQSSQQQGRETNRYQQGTASTTMQSLRLNEPSCMSRMGQQRQLQLLESLYQSKAPQQQQRLQSSTLHQKESLSGQSSTGKQQPLAMHTDESRIHPPVIGNALKSRNDNAYLMALMTNEHTKADMARIATHPTHKFSSQSQPTEASHVGGYSISTSHQGIPSMLHYTALLSQMKQVEKSNPSVVSSPTTTSGGGMKLISQLSQNEVAQLHDSFRQQQLASGVSGAHNKDQHGKRKYSRSVRRASAA